MTRTIDITFHDSLAEIAAEEWDACASSEVAMGGRPADPFTTHRFLLALERSGSVGSGTGWHPRHLVLRDRGAVIGVAPLYAKTHSQGEYIFDHGWADAFERAGGDYYPKLQMAVPFTPVTGRRLLSRPEDAEVARAALLRGAVQLATHQDLSSLHVTFCTEDEVAAGQALGLLPRVTQQYHWLNRDYADFSAFLADLSSRKRKMIRKEREVANGFGGTIRCLTGAQIEAAHWDAFWAFYQDTGSRKWGRPYLTRAFFDEVHATMRDDVMLVLAERAGRAVAGALNFLGRNTIFGRYWGAVEDHPCLHFECCYYRAIDWAIATGLSRVEAGAQGEHKIARGYLPVPIHSLHWIANPSFRTAVARYLEAERRAATEEIEALASYGPFRNFRNEE